MQYIINFLISFIIIYLFYLVTVILQSKKYDKFKNSSQVMYFVKKYKVDVNKINMKKFINIISLTNSFIMAISFTIIIEFDSLILGLLAVFIVSILLTYVFYHMIGNYLKKEGI